jgi:DNA-binding GntR family transcriptional regulator
LGVLSRTIALGLHEDEVVQRGIKGHEKIIELIEAREPELARASMLIHLNESKQDVNNAILKETLATKNLSAGMTVFKV